LNPVEDNVLSHPQVSFSQQNIVRVTRSQYLRLNLKPESIVLREKLQVSSEASKQTMVSSLAYECGKKENPLVFEKNDDSMMLVNFMN